MSGDNSGRNRPQGIGEFLFNEIRSAFQDIRQKVVEEGWFGRVTTPKPVVGLGKDGPEAIGLGKRPTIHEGLGERRPSFEEQWAPRERSKEAADIQKEHGHDLDR